MSETASNLSLTPAGQQMRAEILEAALTLFAEHSYSGTSMGTIAEKCGITKAGLYHYFKTKAELLDHVYAIVNITLSIALQHAQDLGRTPEERLIEIVYAQVKHQVEYRTFLAVFWRERYQLDADARKRVRAKEKVFEKVMMELLIEGQNSGVFRKFDLDIRLPLIFGVLNTVYRWSHHVDKSIDEISQEAVNFILFGIK